MNVANKDLCVELYELSGWWDSSFQWVEPDGLKPHPMHYTPHHQPDYPEFQKGGRNSLDQNMLHPAYDLGYLLRKLPAVIDGSRFLSLSHPDVAGDGTGWVAGYTTNVDHIVRFKVDFSCDKIADTPENAVAELAIELFKQGVLKKGANNAN